jgi:hypothetical protein
MALISGSKANLMGAQNKTAPEVNHLASSAFYADFDVVLISGCSGPNRRYSLSLAPNRRIHQSSHSRARYWSNPE